MSGLGDLFASGEPIDVNSLVSAVRGDLNLDDDAWTFLQLDGRNIILAALAAWDAITDIDTTLGDDVLGVTMTDGDGSVLYVELELGEVRHDD